MRQNSFQLGTERPDHGHLTAPPKMWLEEEDTEETRKIEELKRQQKERARRQMERERELKERNRLREQSPPSVGPTAPG